MGQWACFLSSSAQPLSEVTQSKSRFEGENVLFGAEITSVSRSLYDSKVLYELDMFDVKEAVEIPSFVLACLHYLKAPRMKTKGLFRVSSDFNELQQAKRILGAKKSIDLESLEDLTSDPHLIANLLKVFLRDLIEPVIPFECYDSFLEAKDSSFLLVEQVRGLPELNRNVLLVILRFLVEMLQYEESTLMGPKALAILFAPNLLRVPVLTPEIMLRDSPHQMQCMMTLIEWANKRVAKHV